MAQRTVAVATTEGRMPLYDVSPDDGDPRAAVVVVQEAFGVNDHIEDVTRRVAALGYRAMAPHLYYRTGDPVIDYGDFPAVRPHAQALTERGLGDDLDATLGYLEDAGYSPGGVGVVGFCMGGSIALFAAATRPLGAAVTFYGGGVREGRFGLAPGLELAAQLRCPWLGLYGDRDQSIPVDDVEALREVVGRGSQPAEVLRYAEAGHGFHCDQRPDYHPASAQDAWARMSDWFARYLG